MLVYTCDRQDTKSCAVGYPFGNTTELASLTCSTPKATLSTPPGDPSGRESVAGAFVGGVVAPEVFDVVGPNGAILCASPIGTALGAGPNGTALGTDPNGIAHGADEEVAPNDVDAGMKIAAPGADKVAPIDEEAAAPASAAGNEVPADGATGIVTLAIAIAWALHISSICSFKASISDCLKSEAECTVLPASDISPA